MFNWNLKHNVHYVCCAMLQDWQFQVKSRNVLHYSQGNPQVLHDYWFYHHLVAWWCITRERYDIMINYVCKSITELSCILCFKLRPFKNHSVVFAWLCSVVFEFCSKKVVGWANMTVNINFLSLGSFDMIFVIDFPYHSIPLLVHYFFQNYFAQICHINTKKL